MADDDSEDGPEGLGLVVDLIVEDEAWGDPAALQALADRAAAAVAATMEAEVEILPGTEVAVVLTDDAAIRALNRDHRGIDKATNVLSFPMHEPDEAVVGPLLGDIIVARETVTREADEAGLSIEHHLAHMLVHGLLHLFGHDHGEEDEAETMEALETAILGGLGIADPYAGSEPVRAGSPGD
ncbi:rRNA maturation RNase YbeY [Methylobrevis sp. L22]|uniref:Endoribonuclease YbeY n=1 Tax=Methylobrevis albus TaxID=2793297 RepID=A0A931HZJ5_9HYPH|nr:rRNA maturation RNase YbeY [Methylobrevis albus]